MKAKVKKTGDIINVIPMNGQWAAQLSDRVRYYGDEELDFEFQDWESFRREAAKEILCAMIQAGVDDAWKNVVPAAIDGADELIKQLREGEK